MKTMGKRESKRIHKALRELWTDTGEQFCTEATITESTGWRYAWWS